MKTIGTITFHESINYGAILQTYALQKLLRDMGYSSEVIDYRSPYRRFKTQPLHKKIIHFAWHSLAKRALVGKARERRTYEFLKENIRLSEKTYLSYSELSSNPPTYDAYITGSDQVWNPKNTGADPAYFLTFVPDDKLRISYAPSFGIGRLREEYRSKYCEYLKSIDKLSVREDQGKLLIKEMTGKEAIVVLDPTLLLRRDEWEKKIKPYESNRSYVLCYYMPGDKKVTSLISYLAKEVARRSASRIVSIGQREYMKLIPGETSIFDAGPSEFLGLFRDAEFVVTNSFHGAVFSILFNKSFYIPINEAVPEETKLNSRLISLLHKVGLESRLVKLGSSVGKEIQISESEKAKAGEILEEEKKKSVLFLKESLEDLNDD